MTRARAIVSALSFLMATQSLAAAELGTHEERAGMCDAFAGVAFTFCVAYCEARECDRLTVDDPRCTTILHGFARVTGGATPPCASAASSRRL